MISKNKLKYLRALKLKKFRQKYNNFVVEGEKIAQEILAAGDLEIEAILATDDWLENNVWVKSKYITQTESVSELDLKKISNLKTPNKIFIVAQQKKQSWQDDLIQNNFSLYLDGIQDPGNLGTILRVADWFGIPTVFCSEKCAELYNPKVIQSSMGAFLRVHVIYTSFDEVYERHPNLPFYGTVLDGKNIFEKKTFEKGVIVVGNESQGIAPNILKKINHKILIPKGEHGSAESLNAAVATGIVCAILTNPKF